MEQFSEQELKKHLMLSCEAISHFNDEMKDIIEQDKGQAFVPIQIIMSYCFRIDSYTDNRYADLYKQFTNQNTEELRKH